MRRPPTSYAPALVVLVLTTVATFAALAGVASVERRGGPGVGPSGSATGSGRSPLGGARVAAQAAPGPVYALPVLDMLRRDDVCSAWIDVQNVGDGPTQGVLVVLGGASAGEVGDPQHSFPIGIVCTGLIQPGSAWHLVGPVIPPGEDPNPTATPGGGSFRALQRIEPQRVGRRAALLFSVTSARLADLVDDGTTVDDVSANRLCEALHETVRADSAAWTAFLDAWAAGGTWQGLPLGRMAGEPLRVQAFRTCPTLTFPPAESVAAYAAPRVPSGAGAAYRAVVAGLARTTTPPAEARSLLYIQNVGRRIAQATVRLQAADACAPDATERTLLIQPGDAGVVDLDAIVAAPWRGAAIIESGQPFAVAAEVSVGADTTLEVTSAAETGDGGAAAEPAGPRYAAILLDFGGNRVSAHVTNAGAAAIRPRLTLIEGNEAGTPVLGDVLCPGGSATLSQTVNLDPALDPDGGVGWPVLARIDGLAGDDDTPAADARLPATVQVARRAPGLGGVELQAYAVTARTVVSATRVADVAALAVPGAMHALDTFGLDVELAVSMVGAAPGGFGFSLLVYDHNGLVGRGCWLTGPNESDVIAIRDVPGVLDNAVSSAIIVPTDVGAGASAGPYGALVASVIVRRGTVFGADIPGDEIAAAAAQPIDGPTAAFASLPPCDLPVTEPPPVGAAEGRLAQAAWFAPVVTYMGLDSMCDAAVRVTNRDAEGAQFALVTFGEPAFIDPACAGPSAVVCSPLIAPGKSWDFIFDRNANVMSAVAIGFRGASLDALGIAPGDARTGADVLCGDADLVGGCATWRRLIVALSTDGAFGGMPLADVAAPIGVSVGRSCLNVNDVQVLDVADYDAVPLADVARGRTRPERYVYTVAQAHNEDADTANKAGLETVIYLQNAGPRSVSIGIALHDDGGQATGGHVLALASGECYALYASDLVSAPWRGWVSLASDGPLAVVADAETNPVTSRPSTAGGDRCDVNADGAVDGWDVATVYKALGSVPGDARGRWNPRADLDLSGAIDHDDVAIAAACLGAAPIPTDIAILRPTAPTPTLWSPLETPGTP
ncbi:MAG: hypothetical protein ABI780_12825, partial [Ardenticatenales bacterium]